jgi:hypothetical protein
MTFDPQAEARSMLLYWEKYYVIPPNTKTLRDCAEHGATHCAYGWPKFPDPRWNSEQIEAYLAAYCYAPHSPC